MDERNAIVIATVSLVINELMGEDPLEVEEEIAEDFPLLLLVNKFLKQRTKAVRVENYAEADVPNYSPSDFRSHFRLSLATFEKLTLEIGNFPEIPKGPQHGGRPPISVSKHLLIALWLLGTPESIRSVSDRFNVTKSSVFLCFRRVCEALKNHVASRVIKWPTEGRAKIVMEGFRQLKGMPGVIGAIDGSHIPIKAPEEYPENYVNRKGFHSVVLQGICDHEMRFVNCYTGWPGSVHDSRVLKNSDFFLHMRNEDKFPCNSYLLGDSAYPLETWMMTPYRDNGHLTNQQRRYNYIHSSSRMVIERAFALLKGRFRRLKYLDITRIQDIPGIIIVACVLHNICLDNGEQHCDFMEDPETEINSFEDVLTPGSQAAEKRREIMEIICIN